MSRRKTNQLDSMYAGARWQRLYSDVYSRSSTTWQTRTGRRNYEFSTFANLLGLNTAFDDIHKSDGESPYLRNVRYMGEREQIQRAQVTSRTGANLLGVKSFEITPALDPEYHLEMWEGRSLEFDLPKQDTVLIGGALEIRNVEKAKGRLRIFLKQEKNAREICDGCVDLENISNTQRCFEQLTFNADGTLTGMRKWQTRKPVTIDGEQRYTDWEDVGLSGTFTGTWQLRYWSPEGNSSEKRNCLQLEAKYDEARNYMAYSYVATFDYADETTLRFQGYYAKDEDGRVNFLRGDAEPSF